MTDEFFFNSDEDDDTISLPPLANSANGIPGLLVSVRIDSSALVPRIDNGELVLPANGNGSGISGGVVYAQGIAAPYISNNTIFHPFAQQGENGTSTHAGILAGIGFGSAVQPVIEDGKIFIPHANSQSGSSVAGVITNLRTSSVTAPAIVDGELQLPLDSITKGVKSMNGNAYLWEDIGMSTAAVDVARLGDIALAVWQEDGFICFSLHS
jgi:hypothetical protein